MGRQTKYNQITSPELLAQVNQSNLQLKDEFMDYLKSIQRSDGTRKGYDSDLQIFFVWVLQYAKNKDFSDITKRDLIAFQNWLINENGNSPARVRRIKAAISSLSNYITDILDEEPEFEGYKSIVRKIANPPLQAVREKTVWSDEDIDCLLSKLIEKKDYEKACYVALAAFGGRRKAELLRFKMSDFTDDHLVCDGALYRSSPIMTKGNKMLECYTLAKRFKPYLDAWVKYRTDNGIDSEWLFPNPADSNEPRSITSVSAWSDTLSNISGRDFYPHSLRHYFVSLLSREGIPDNVVVQIVGWSSADMFNLYNDNPKDAQIAMYFKDGEISAASAKSINDV